MELRETGIDGLVEIVPRIFPDERGIFLESYNKKRLKEIGLDQDFVQDNLSKSKKGVLRGLHFQREPHGQGKLVSVIDGKVLDVVVDIRKGSKTFGEIRYFEIDSERRNMVFVPAGFAHGFVALEETILSYKCTNYYNQASESGIIWNDADLNIDWRVEKPLVSDKDLRLPGFASLLN